MFAGVSCHHPSLHMILSLTWIALMFNGIRTIIAVMHKLSTHFRRGLQEELVIKQNNFGQYISEGTVNEQAVAFMVDTGASMVSLPPSVAQAAQLNCQDQVLIHTATGSTQGCSITIPKFKFGSFVLNNVLAFIVPNLSRPLLGMNVLQQFKIAQDQGEMHISDSL